MEMASEEDNLLGPTYVSPGNTPIVSSPIGTPSLQPVTTHDTSILGVDSPPEPLRSLLPLEVRKVEAQKLLLFFFIVAFPIFAPELVTYDMLYDVACHEYDVPKAVCYTDPEMGKVVANYLSVSSTLSGVIGMFAVPFFAALSDRWGRRPIILMSFWMYLLVVAALAVLPFGVPRHTTHWRLLCIDFVNACMGSGLVLTNALILTLMDLLPEVQIQARYWSLMSGSLSVAQAICGAFLGPVYIKLGYSKFLNLLLVIQLVVVALGYYIVPETETSKDRKTASKKMGITQMMKIMWFVGDDIPPDTKRNGRIFVVTTLVGIEFFIGLMPIISLFGKQQFGWTGREIGLCQSLEATVKAVYSLFGFPLIYAFISNRYGEPPELNVWQPDIWLMQLSQFLDFTGFFLMGSATNTISYMIGIFVSANQNVAGPLHTNTQLRLVPPGSRGEFMAAKGFLTTVASVIIPSLILKLYSAMLGTAPRLIFFIVGLLSVSVFFSYFLLKPLKLKQPYSAESPETPGSPGPDGSTEISPLL